MNPQRKFWNQQQKTLRHALLRSDNQQQALDLFLSQHVMVHSAVMAQSGEAWSFEDEIWQDLSEEAIRCIPRNGNHSIAWIIWHIARIEDVTMNLLVADTPQILHQDNWFERMQITVRDTGNTMNDDGVVNLSAAIAIESLQAYRMAVGRRTREIVQQLRPEDFTQNVAPARLQRVRDEGAVLAAAEGVIEYWGKRNIAGLLLMPATRHNFLHLNEARRVKQKCA